jgi:hypothetical protein
MIAQLTTEQRRCITKIRPGCGSCAPVKFSTVACRHPSDASASSRYRPDRRRYWRQSKAPKDHGSQPVNGVMAPASSHSRCILTDEGRTDRPLATSGGSGASVASPARRHHDPDWQAHRQREPAGLPAANRSSVQVRSTCTARAGRAHMAGHALQCDVLQDHVEGGAERLVERQHLGKFWFGQGHILTD